MDTFYFLKNVLAGGFILLCLVGAYFSLWPNNRKKKDERPIVYNQQEDEDGDETESFYHSDQKVTFFHNDKPNGNE